MGEELKAFKVYALLSMWERFLYLHGYAFTTGEHTWKPLN